MADARSCLLPRCFALRHLTYGLIWKIPDGMGLPAHDILDLFDDAGSADEIDRKISDFLSAPARSDASKLTDVLVY